jgi:HEAT repeat protein
MMQYYCPACFAEVPFADRDKPCAVCGTVADVWVRTRSYTERLLHALRHPNSEARMAAIISLGNRREPVAAMPLAECALAHPIDVVQALEIVQSVRKLPAGPERATALAMLAQHPARAVRAAIAAFVQRLQA